MNIYLKETKYEFLKMLWSPRFGLMTLGIPLLELNADIKVIAQAGDGKLALRAVEDARPDVLITDIEMSNMTGLELAAEIKAQRIETRVTILTTFARWLSAACHGCRRAWLRFEGAACERIGGCGETHASRLASRGSGAGGESVGRSGSSDRPRTAGPTVGWRWRDLERHSPQTAAVRRHCAELFVGSDQQAQRGWL